MKKDILTAYHEAGHVLACYELKRGFTEVNIFKLENQLGVVMVTPYDFSEAIWERNLKVRSKLEKDVVISLAGFIAEKKYFQRKRLKFLYTDHGEAIDLLSSQCESNVETYAYLNYLWEKTINLLNRDHVWKSVETIAEQLLIKKRLTYKQCRIIINEVFIKDFEEKKRK